MSTLWPHTQTEATIIHAERPLDYTVYRADSRVAKGLGLMGRRGVPGGTALALPCSGVSWRAVHMAGVRAPLRVWWVTDGRLERSERLAAWTGVARAPADLILELPPDAPAGSVGATVDVCE